MADNQFLALLEQNRPKIEPLIAPYFDKELWFHNAKAVWNAVQRSEELRACSMQSIVGCVEEAARRGLEIGGPNKHCALVAFKTTAILITQWQGKAFIWMKSGAIKKLDSRVVYEGDKFEIYQGDEDRIVHSPNLIDDRPPAWQNNIKNIVGAYAIATLWSGERVHSFVNRAYMVRLIEWVKNKNKGKLGFGYQDWLPEMFQKTAVHRLDGKIQPPPHMDPEQIAAWQRAGRASSVEAEFEHVDELPPDDLPKADEPRDEVRLVTQKVVDEATERAKSLKLTPDKAPATIKDTQDEEDLLETWRKVGRKRSELAPWLKDNYGIDDLADFPMDKEMVAECSQRMASEQ